MCITQKANCHKLQCPVYVLDTSSFALVFCGLFVCLFVLFLCCFGGFLVGFVCLVGFFVLLLFFWGFFLLCP